MAKLTNIVSKNLRGAGRQSRIRSAKEWLQKEIRNLGSITSNRKNRVSKLEPGSLYFYFYDPKTKEDLPYYDKFPLVLPIEMYSDGFLALNFHYIRPKERIALMDKLYETVTNELFDDTTKLRTSYSLLNGAARFNAFKPCVKRYLFSHVQSGIIKVPPSDWEMALMLPVDSFVGAGRAKIYRDSESKY